jgi:hypothetical protein
MNRGECLRIFVVLALLANGCAFGKQQAKSSADTQCASSCKNQPADTQGECIAHCTK